MQKPRVVLALCSLIIGVACGPSRAPVNAASTSSDGGVSAPMVGASDAGSLPIAKSELHPRSHRIATGSGHTCALKPDGSVWCWGMNSFGQLGDGTQRERFTPSRVPGVTDAIAVTAGSMHTCVLRRAGVVMCWGARGAAPNDGQDLRPTAVNLADVVEVSAGASHSCALTAAHHVFCWGANNTGQIGDGTHDLHREPFEVADVTDAVEVTAGVEQSCARTGDGQIQCWGDPIWSTRGDGLREGSSLPVFAKTITDATAVSAAFLHTCAIHSGGIVACWGNLGPSTADRRLVPEDVAGVSDATDVIAANGTTCALDRAGSVWCWGMNNTRGELGRGKISNENKILPPAQVQGLPKIIELAGKFGHFCGLTDAGELWCWGNNDFGQLAVGSHLRALAPIDVGLIGATAISSGSMSTCAVKLGKISCLTGAGEHVLPTITDAVSLSSGAETCVRRRSGRVACFSALGSVWSVCKAAASMTPVDVPGIENAIDVDAGDSQSCAVTGGGNVLCWRDVHGDLLPPSAKDGCAAVRAPKITNAKRVAVGQKHVCALLSSGAVSCWGENAAGLGDGAHTESASPIPVTGITDAIAITSGPRHACALRKGGVVSCWGDGARGELGDGTRSSHATPIDVPLARDIVRVSAGGGFTCALHKSGNVSCWGDGYNGTLGTGVDDRSELSPVLVAGLADAIDLSAGARHSCVIRGGNGVSCWGGNEGGELGTPLVLDEPTPLRVSF